MKRAISVLSMYLLVLATTPSFAGKGSTSGAHFFSDTSATVDLSSGGLVIHIDEGGLGQAETDYTVTADASATYQCFNGGGNHPKAGNKQTVGSTVTNTFPVNPINGRVQVTITLTGTPLAQGSFSCPSGQDLYLQSVSYTDIVITDTTNNVVAPTLTVSVSNLHLLIP
jgi:hypothetical protein